MPFGGATWQEVQFFCVVGSPLRWQNVHAVAPVTPPTPSRFAPWQRLHASKPEGLDLQWRYHGVPMGLSVVIVPKDTGI